MKFHEMVQQLRKKSTPEWSAISELLAVHDILWFLEFFTICSYVCVNLLPLFYIIYSFIVLYKLLQPCFFSQSCIGQWKGNRKTALVLCKLGVSFFPKFERQPSNIKINFHGFRISLASGRKNPRTHKGYFILVESYRHKGTVVNTFSKVT